MKIKEVIAVTGLTDRAIRLYIEHGLLFPDTKENYSGRRNIEFCDGDVEKLKNISLLRRAGFSIAQIKVFDEGGEVAETVLREFIAEKQIQHELDGKVLVALNSFIKGETSPTLSSIAAQLTDEMLANADNADLRPGRGERIKNILFIIFLVIAITSIAFEIIYPLVYYISEFKHPKYDGNLLSLVNALMGPAALVLTVFLLNLRLGKLRRKVKRGVRRGLSIGLSLFIAIHIVLSPIHTAFMCISPFICSETADSGDYLKFDNYVLTTSKGEILKLFPDNVPDSVERKSDGEPDIHYYYNYTGGFGPRIDIFAEWSMSRTEFKKEKSRIEAYSEANDAVHSLKGTYHFYSFETRDNGSSCGLFMAAYDDATKTVRYGYYNDTMHGAFIFGASSLDPADSYMCNMDWRK